MEKKNFPNEVVNVNAALASLNDSAIMLKNAVRQFFKNQKTTEAQFNILLRLKYADHPVTPKALSEELLVDKSNLTGLVDRMEKAGHLRRSKAENDRRSHHLELTPQAEQLLQELELPYRNFQKSIMGNFSEEELIMLTRIMQKLQKSLEDRCFCSSNNHFYWEK